MLHTLRRLLALFSPRDPAPTGGLPLDRRRRRTGALAEMQRAVSDANAAKVERAAEHAREARTTPPRDV